MYLKPTLRQCAENPLSVETRDDTHFCAKDSLSLWWSDGVTICYAWATQQARQPFSTSVCLTAGSASLQQGGCVLYRPESYRGAWGGKSELVEWFGHLSEQAAARTRASFRRPWAWGRVLEQWLSESGISGHMRITYRAPDNPNAGLPHPPVANPGDLEWGYPWVLKEPSTLTNSDTPFWKQHQKHGWLSISFLSRITAWPPQALFWVWTYAHKIIFPFKMKPVSDEWARPWNSPEKFKYGLIWWDQLFTDFTRSTQRLMCF